MGLLAEQVGADKKVGGHRARDEGAKQRCKGSFEIVA